MVNISTIVTRVLIRPAQKYTVYVETYAINMYAKYQPHPPYDFFSRRVTTFSFQNFKFSSIWQPSKFTDLNIPDAVARSAARPFAIT